MNQRLFADENFPAPSILILREAGHDVQSVAEAAASTADQAILAMAVAQQRWIVTFDRDFGELIFRRGLAAPSCVPYFRLRHYLPETPGTMLVEFLKKHTALSGYFVVLEDDGVRMRPLSRVV